MKRSIMTVVVAAMIATACSPTSTRAGAQSGDAADGVMLSAPGEPAVAAAEMQARKSLPVFWEKLAAKTPGYGDFALKVAFKVRGGGTEYIWTRPLSRQGDDLVVRLANEPLYVAKLKLGSEVRVSASDVTDWAYARDGKLYGHFSTRAMLAKASPADRAQLDAVLAPTPLEPEVH